MSFMRPRKTLQLGFDKQFQPSDEISLGRGAKRVVLCKHEKSGWGIEVLTWSQNLSILWLWHSMDCSHSYLGISVTACRRHLMAVRIHNTLITGSLFTAGTFTWEAAWQGATLTVTGGWLTSSPSVTMVTGVTPHHGHHHTMCHPGVSLHNAITHLPRESLAASARTDWGHEAMCPPQGRAGHWLSRCAPLSCLQLSLLSPCGAHCWPGRSVMAGLGPPAHHGLGSL